MLSGCGTPPKTVEEFRRDAPKSAFVDQLEFEVPNATLPVVKKRLQSFADKCLNMSVRKVCSGGGPCVQGPVGNVTYTPKIHTTSNQVSLSLQELYTKSNIIYTTTPPKDGFFIFLTDVKVGKDSRLHGVAYAGTKSLVQVASNWARDEKHLCPNLY
jgi:hypothetical protein